MVLQLIRKPWESAAWMAAWGLAIAAGMLVMHAYALSPGDPGTPPAHWPAGSRLGRDGIRPQLLIFLHSRCPCSRASVTELAEILARCKGRLAARAVLYRPSASNDAWFEPGLVAELMEIPGLEITADPDGEEARRFGLATSGHVLLFDASGALKFSGGLTLGRGQSSDEAVRSALLARLIGPSPGGPDQPVFGCPLSNCRPNGESRQP